MGTGAKQVQGTSEAQVRVILIGRTGLDAKLRLDPTVEMVRVRSGLEAIGELADPIDETSPRRAVVIVGGDADPAAHGGNGLRDSSAELVRGLRTVDPSVRVLRSLSRQEKAGGNGAHSAAYDGSLDADAPLESLRTALLTGPEPVAAVVQPAPVIEQPAASQASPPAQPPTPVVTTPSAISTPAPASVAAPITSPTPPPAAQPARVEGGYSATSAAAEVPAPPSEPQASTSAARSELAPTITPEAAAETSHVDQPIASSLAGDEAIAAVLLRGGDVLPVAVSLLQQRLADPTIAFTPGAFGAAPVQIDDQVLGNLSSERTPSETLAAHTPWLAAWLRVSEQQSQLRQAAFTDYLTGAWNRRYFDRFLNAAIDRARTAHLAITVLVFDIDNFKKYNDTYGHAAADEILIETVRLLSSVIRPSDRVCRIGGDEFAVIFHEPTGPRVPGSTPPASVTDIAQRFQAQIRQHRFPRLGAEAPGSLTISGGLATYPWDGQSPEQLVEAADARALESKRKGKNAITFGPDAEPRP